MKKMYEFEEIKEIGQFKKIKEPLENLAEMGEKNPFTEYEWLEEWLKAFGKNIKLNTIVVKKDGRVVGVFPLCLKINSGVKILKFVGEGESDYSDFVIARSINEEVSKQFVSYLKQSKAWDLCELKDICEDSENKSHIIHELKKQHLLFKLLKSYECPYIGINTTFDKYFNKKDRKTKYNIRREIRILANLGKLEFKKIEGLNDLNRRLPEIFEIHKRKWENYYTATRFSNKAGMGFYANIAKNYQEKGLLDLSILTLDDKAIAFSYSFKVNQKYYFYITSFDIKYIKYSPGKILVYYLIKYAFDTGMKEFDFMKGDESYKSRWAIDARCNTDIIISKRNIKGYICFYGYLLMLKSNNIIKKLKFLRKIIANVRNLKEAVQSRGLTYIPPESVVKFSLIGKTSKRRILEEYPGAFIFNQGREAIVAGINALRPKDKCKILLPSYLCESIVTAVKYAGIKYDYYKINEDFSIDLDSLDEMSRSSSIVFIIHYYGFPQNLNEIKRISKRNNNVLMEDYTHGVFSKYEDKYLGFHGDVGVCSLRKSLPLYEGAMLLLNNKENTSCFNNQGIRDRLAFGDILKILNLALKNLEFKFGFSIRKYLLSNDKLKTAYMKREIEKDINVKQGISKTSKLMLNSINAEEIVLSHRKNYKYYLENLIGNDKIGIPFKSLDEGICPLGFPVLIENRNLIRNCLLRSGINLRSYWDKLPDDVSEKEHFKSHKLSSQILVLPVHMDLKESHLSYIVKRLKHEISNC